MHWKEPFSFPFFRRVSKKQNCTSVAECSRKHKNPSLLMGYWIHVIQYWTKAVKDLPGNSSKIIKEALISRMAYSYVNITTFMCSNYAESAKPGFNIFLGWFPTVELKKCMVLQKNWRFSSFPWNMYVVALLAQCPPGGLHGTCDSLSSMQAWQTNSVSILYFGR